MKRMMSSLHLLILANVMAFVLEFDAPDAVLMPLALWPIGQGFAPWQLVTYAFFTRQHQPSVL